MADNHKRAAAAIREYLSEQPRTIEETAELLRFLVAEIGLDELEAGLPKFFASYRQQLDA